MRFKRTLPWAKRLLGIGMIGAVVAIANPTGQTFTFAGPGQNQATPRLIPGSNQSIIAGAVAGLNLGNNSVLGIRTASVSGFTFPTPLPQTNPTPTPVSVPGVTTPSPQPSPTAMIDNQAPTVPGSITATYDGQSQIVVSWGGSSDNVGVTAYRLYRGTGILTLTPGTAYADGAVTAGNTYTYMVTAVDAAGNESAPTAVVSVTITLPPTPTPAPTVTPIPVLTLN